jgi:hypothetical protein
MLLAIASFSPAISRAAETDAGETPSAETETVCPPELVSSGGAPRPPAVATAPSADDPVIIEADDKDFTFDVNGNAVLSGNVVMRMDDKVIRADRLEYDAKSGRAKLTGAVESRARAQGARQQRRVFPTVGVPEGAQFELPRANARGAARKMQVDERHGTLDDVASTCPLTDRARRSSRSASCSIRVRTRAPGAARRSSSRTCRSSIYPG